MIVETVLPQNASGFRPFAPAVPLMNCGDPLANHMCTRIIFYQVQFITVPLPIFVILLFPVFFFVYFLYKANQQYRREWGETPDALHFRMMKSSINYYDFSTPTGMKLLPFYYSYIQFVCLLYLVNFIVLGFFSSWLYSIFVIIPIVFFLMLFSEFYVIGLLMVKDISRKNKLIALGFSLLLSLSVIGVLLYAQHKEMVDIFTPSCTYYFGVFYTSVYSFCILLYISSIILSRILPSNSNFSARPAVRTFCGIILFPKSILLVACICLMYEIDLGLCLWAVGHMFYYLVYAPTLNYTFILDSIYLNEKEIEETQKPLLSSHGFATREQIINWSDLEIRERIGVGGSGEVHFAYWNGCAVAVKKIFFKNVSHSEIEEFKQETLILSKLNHPNIVKLLGVCIERPNLAIVTEYVPRGNLSELLHSSMTLEWNLCLAMAKDIAKGMTYLHSLEPKLLHRDLKSGNILVGDNFQIKISDFGIARFKEEKTMTSIGTVPWTAPEVLRGNRYNEKADVYSFSIILWEIKTRESPFKELSYFEILTQVIHKQARPPLPLTLDAEYKRLITDCWSESADLRPTFDEIQVRLDSMMNPS